jgi:hypothetical protein
VLSVIVGLVDSDREDVWYELDLADMVVDKSRFL